MRVKFNILIGTNILLVSCIIQLIHILALSPQSHGLYCMGILANTGVESGFSRLWYGVRVVQTTLQALFLSTITGVVVQDFRSSSVPVTHKGYLVESCRSL